MPNNQAGNVNDGYEKPWTSSYDFPPPGQESETVSVQSSRPEKTGSVVSEVALPVHPDVMERTCRDYWMFSILVLINLLNYIDRYTVAGVLEDIQDYFDIDDSKGGLLQTVFMIAFIICSPICGYLGDRYNRKWVMVVGITVWVLAVIGSTFIPNDKFWYFAACRCVVGVGEASYAVICPSLIADMFTGTMRSRMLMIFYFAIPVGSGLGYIVGGVMASVTGQWQWGLRVSAIAGVICLALIILFVSERPRGVLEIGDMEGFASQERSYLKDLLALLCNGTFVTSTLAYTGVVFVTGTLAWWAPTAVVHAEAASLGLNDTSLLDPKEHSKVTFIFGAIVCISGFVGVTIGTLGSNMLRRGQYCLRTCKTKRSDSVLCTIGAILAVPTLFGVIQLVPVSLPAAYVCVFFAVTGLSFNWAINVDMLMSVVIPARRSTANAVQILTSHLLGDGSGPYVIGAISDAIRNGDNTSVGHSTSLLKSFYLPNAILFLAVALYIASAFTLPRDLARFKEEIAAFNEAKRTKHDDGARNDGFSLEENTTDNSHGI